MKTLLSRFSAKENTLMMSDIVRVIDSNTFQRYVYAGNAIETVKNTSNPIVRNILLLQIGNDSAHIQIHFYRY